MGSVPRAATTRYSLSDLFRMKTLFLDFDGVLHTMSDQEYRPFNRLPLIEELKDIAAFEVVISSSWRFHFELASIKARLGRLSDCVVGTTGEAIQDRHARYLEIAAYASDYQLKDWRALDDAHWEFPEGVEQLIACDPKLGVTEREVRLLRDWLLT